MPDLYELVELFADAQDAGERLDRFLSAALPELSRSAVQRLVTEGAVAVGGVALPKSYRLRGGEDITVRIDAPREATVEPENIPLEIVYEDTDLLVVNKPKGMVVHPAPGNPSGTLVNALLYHCRDSLSGVGGELRPGIVHRIDKNTSGLLVVAKNDRAHNGLAEQFKTHDLERCYEAVVYGAPKDENGTVNAPIGRHPTDRKRMTVTDRHARHAVTHYETLAKYRGFSHLALRLETGRTHQIRVHMAHIGHPVAGDEVYGPRKVITELQGQCLHARTLGFVHPVTGQTLSFTSELPAYFQTFLTKLQKEG